MRLLALLDSQIKFWCFDSPHCILHGEINQVVSRQIIAMNNHVVPQGLTPLWRVHKPVNWTTFGYTSFHQNQTGDLKPAGRSYGKILSALYKSAIVFSQISITCSHVLSVIDVYPDLLWIYSMLWSWKLPMSNQSIMRSHWATWNTVLKQISRCYWCALLWSSGRVRIVVMQWSSYRNSNSNFAIWKLAFNS